MEFRVPYANMVDKFPNILPLRVMTTNGFGASVNARVFVVSFHESL